MSNHDSLDSLSLEEIEARLRNMDRDRAVLQRALQNKRQKTRKHVAQEVKDLIQARGHDLADILDLIANKKRSNGRGHSYVHYVDPENPKQEYVRGVLPGWMKKKLALALAVLHKPRLLILDEPANGLDPLATRVLLELLTEQAIAGTAILFSTHLLDQAEKFCHRAVIIARGQLVAEGNIDDLRNQAANGGNLEQAFFALTAESQDLITQPTDPAVL